MHDLVKELLVWVELVLFYNESTYTFIWNPSLKSK